MSALDDLTAVVAKAVASMEAATPIVSAPPPVAPPDNSAELAALATQLAGAEGPLGAALAARATPASS